MIVMAIIAMLITIALPQYFYGLQRGKEATLKQDLTVMRSALDKYFGDKGVYPQNLGDLVTNRYIRAIPVDPITERNDTWIIVPPQPPQQGGVFDLKSGAEGVTHDGVAYNQL
jgi:general secretion pathway protein G